MSSTAGMLSLPSKSHGVIETESIGITTQMIVTELQSVQPVMLMVGFS